MGSDLVSVVVPTYYRNDRLRAAVESVAAQTYEPIELIVVDDSGEGHAAPVLESRADVSYVPLEENRGAHAARKAGLDHSSGAYVQFLDDDDRLRPSKIERQLAVFHDQPEIGVVYCGREWETGEVDRPNPDVRGDVLEYALGFQMNPCLTSMMLVRRPLLEEIPMHGDLGGADDIAMKIELATRTRFEFVDEPLVVAGEPDWTLGTSWSAIDGRRAILREYADLYDRVQPSVRARALAETHSKAGRRHLEDRRWSWRAILAFGRAVYHDPDHRLLYWAEFASSLFGRPGRHLARVVGNRIAVR